MTAPRAGGHVSRIWWGVRSDPLHRRRVLTAGHLGVLLGVFTMLWHAAVLGAPDQATALARYLGAVTALVVGTFAASTLMLLRNPYDERAWWNPLEFARPALNDVRDPMWEDRTDDCELAPDGGCVDDTRRPGPVWPYGLAAEAGVTAGALALATRRQGVPV